MAKQMFLCRQDQLPTRTGRFGTKSALKCICESSLLTQVEALCIISTRLALLHVPRGVTGGIRLANERQRFHLAPTRLRLLLGSWVFSPLCSESLQAFVSVLSRVDAGAQVEAPPSAAAATASGINPVSTEALVDYEITFSLFIHS